jgi:glycerol-3-phosphate dehydrogenase subunit C
MENEPKKERPSARSLIRSVVDTCADCDICRFLMEDSCLFFPELYRLHDRETEQKIPPGGEELDRLADMCTLCGLCPCPNIRTDIVRSKATRVRNCGLPLGLRMLADVQSTGRLGSRVPKLMNTVLQVDPAGKAAKHFAGISQKRHLPKLPAEDFFSWAKRKHLTQKPDRLPAAAYFAGCTAGYLFPKVAKAAVKILEKNGLPVYTPPQQCCGMPTLLEGMESLTRTRVQKNLSSLLAASDAGFDLLTTCPTCGFFMKILLREGAHYSQDYQKAAGAGANEICIPQTGSGKGGHTFLQKSIYGKILRDSPHFTGIDPLARIRLSEALLDMGEYLVRMHREGRFDTNLGCREQRLAYFAPCHQREQNIGSPYEELLAFVPGLEILRIGGSMDCCGMGGSLGFKESFHNASVRLGQPLAEKIKEASPEAIVTDCLSCRLQFQHLLPSLPVFHPLEIIAAAYGL